MPDATDTTGQLRREVRGASNGMQHIKHERPPAGLAAVHLLNTLDILQTGAHDTMRHYDAIRYDGAIQYEGVIKYDGRRTAYMVSPSRLQSFLIDLA